MRKVLRLSVLLLIGLVLSCQEDEGLSSIESKSRKDDSAQLLNNGFRVQQLNQEQIQQNQELQELLEQTNLIASENNSLYQAQSSSANSATLNLDLSQASYVSSADGSQEFYTFYVEDSSGDGFKNVVLSKQGEELQVLLLRYDVTEQEMLSYQAGEPIDFTGRTSVTMLDTNSIALQSQTSSGCTDGYWIEITYYKEIPCDGDRSILGDYPCENWMPSTYQLVTESIYVEGDCGSGGGITPNPGDNTTNPPFDWGSIFDGTGGGGGGTPSNDGSVNGSSTGEEQQTEPQEPSLEFGTSPVIRFRPIEEQIENCMAYYGDAPTTEQSQFLSTLAERGEQSKLQAIQSQACVGNTNLVKSLLELATSAETNESPVNIDFFSIIDGDEPSPEEEKLLCILQKLTETNTFKEILNDIFGEDVNVETLKPGMVNFEIAVLGNQRSGTTNPNYVLNEDQTAYVVKDYTIQIDKNHIAEGLNLDTALTVIHELLHAFMYNVLENDGVVDSTIFFDDFVECLNAYNNQYNSNNGTSTSAQHQFMAENLLPIMAQMLEEIFYIMYGSSQLDFQALSTHVYDENSGVVSAIPNSFNLDEFFNYFPYNGLEETNYFQGLIGDFYEDSSMTMYTEPWNLPNNDEVGVADMEEAMKYYSYVNKAYIQIPGLRNALMNSDECN